MPPVADPRGCPDARHTDAVVPLASRAVDGATTGFGPGWVRPPALSRRTRGRPGILGGVPLRRRSARPTRRGRRGRYAGSARPTRPHRPGTRRPEHGRRGHGATPTARARPARARSPRPRGGPWWVGTPKPARRARRAPQAIAARAGRVPCPTAAARRRTPRPRPKEVFRGGPGTPEYATELASSRRMFFICSNARRRSCPASVAPAPVRPMQATVQADTHAPVCGQQECLLRRTRRRANTAHTCARGGRKKRENTHDSV